ncbi:hypothetical protein [Parvularcula sp. IMCC14364]|uniref:aldose epimerase family protein n=1 Tax=Parvularcula sp. IMCC14364 TaxID=3067902 RepID=UPI0027422E6C|nr:hypothetical protein [Parvularcula sp. IMCC14364]
MEISKRISGYLETSEPVHQYTLCRDGLAVEILEYGGIITRISVPDREGTVGNIVLGYEMLPAYIADRHYIGRLIGRVANRVSGGQFSIQGKTYQLPLNLPPHHLHGGPGGVSDSLWQGAIADDGRS